MRSVLIAGLVIIAGMCWMGNASGVQTAKEAEPSTKSQGGKQAVKQVEGPSLKVLDKIYKFGEAFEGTVLTHDFTIKNTGTKELIIKQVNPFPGCKVTGYDKSIAPGGEGKISVEVDLNETSGSMRKNILIVSNDSRRPAVAVTVVGVIQPYITVKPSQSIFFRGPAEKLPEAKIDLISSKNTFHITKVESTLKDKIKYSLETVKEGSHYQLKVTNIAKQGQYSGKVIIHTDFPKRPSLTIRVDGNVEGVIGVKPSRVMLGNAGRGRSVNKGKILVYSLRKEPFVIKKITYEKKFLEVTQKKDEKNNGYILELTPKLASVPKGAQQRVPLFIETDANPGSKVEVEVYVVNR